MDKKIHQDFKFDADLITEYQQYMKEYYNKDISDHKAREDLGSLSELFLAFGSNRSHGKINS